MEPLDKETWDAVLGHPDTKLNPPAPATAIDAFEAHQRVVLPASHRQFLLRANGGEIGCARLFGVGQFGPLDLSSTIEQMQAFIEGIESGQVMPFANDWGGSYFCYDLHRRTAKGDYPVLRWNHEFSEEPADRPHLWSEFAPDFVGFLKGIID
jgi:SMI1 / KNR4 family (SUKH-1)